MRAAEPRYQTWLAMVMPADVLEIPMAPQLAFPVIDLLALQLEPDVAVRLRGELWRHA